MILRNSKHSRSTFSLLCGGISFCLLLLAFGAYAEELVEEPSEFAQSVLTRADPQAVEFARELLSQEKYSHFNEAKVVHGTKKLSKCFGTTANIGINENSEIFVLTSFSVPLASWLSTSKQLEKTGGKFVLQGIPENQFSLFAKTVLEIRRAGVKAEISIDPMLFQDLNVQRVPCFVLKDGSKLDQLSGNVSLEFALEKFALKGETSSAAALLSLLREAS